MLCPQGQEQGQQQQGFGWFGVNDNQNDEKKKGDTVYDIRDQFANKCQLTDNVLTYLTSNVALNCNLLPFFMFVKVEPKKNNGNQAFAQGIGAFGQAGNAPFGQAGVGGFNFGGN